MRKFVAFLKVLGALTVVVLAGIVLGWLGTGGSAVAIHSEPPSAIQSSPASATPTTPAAPAPLPQPGETIGVQQPALGVQDSSSGKESGWEDQVAEVLSAESNDADKVREMLALFPRLPEEGQVEVAQHLAYLLPDQDYPVLGQLLANPAIPESVSEVIMAGALDRPDTLKLPLFLDIARNEQNPAANNARDLLQAYLEKDYGRDWSAWQSGINQWLVNNPE